MCKVLVNCVIGRKLARSQHPSNLGLKVSRLEYLYPSPE